MPLKYKQKIRRGKDTAEQNGREKLERKEK